MSKVNAIEILVDADIVAYRCAASAENEEEWIAHSRCNDLMERIIESVGADTYTLYISGGSNFRKQLAPSYKANRVNTPQPKWRESCKEYLIREWKAKVTDGIEADDALGIAQREDTYICSIDKDLLQIPGMHYNFVKDEEYYITPQQGLYNFWTQMLVGDVADNVKGVTGIGVKKAAIRLNPIFEYAENTEENIEVTNEKYYNLVEHLYNDKPRMHLTAMLLHIQKKEGDVWLSPSERKLMQVEQINPNPKPKRIQRKTGLTDV